MPLNIHENWSSWFPCLSKEEDSKFLKMQTCVLRVNIHCDGCKQKVRKVLQKIDGVDNIAIDGEHGKVIVSGSIDPATIMRKLAKAGKHADLWSTPKGGNFVIINNKQLKNQCHNTQIDHKSGQRDVKSQMGCCKNQKNASLPPQKQQQLQLQQLNGLKELKQPQSKSSWFPFKRQKSVKSTRRQGDLGDEFDMFDDEFDDDFDLDDDVLMKPHSLNDKQMKPKNGQVPVKGCPFMNGQVNGGNFKSVQVPIKDGNNQGGKYNNGGNKLWPGNNGGVNQSQNAGGKNGEWKNKIAPSMANVGGAKGNIHHKVGGDQGFLEVDLSKKATNGGGIMGGSNGKMGYSALPPPAANPAVQSLPMNAGNSFGGVVSPPEKMSGNQYLQQQYIAQMMMLQQQQQQQQQRYNAGFQPLSFGRPQPSVSYGPHMPPSHYYPPPTPEYAHYFNDENTNSCSIM